MKYHVSFHAKNMISSHMKITRYFHMWKDHCCYGYIINRIFCSKKIFKVNGLAFHWRFIEHYMAAWRYEISLLMLKNISTWEEKFCISKRPCNILHFFYLFMQDSFEGVTYFKLFMCTWHSNMQSFSLSFAMLKKTAPLKNATKCSFI